MARMAVLTVQAKERKTIASIRRLRYQSPSDQRSRFPINEHEPNIRYTDSLNYVVAKGQAQPRKKKAVTTEQKTARAMLAPTEQYPKLAAMIKKHPSWKGTKFSWGDAFIDKCSRGECVGNPTDWRAVGTCHHIALV